MSAKFRDPPDFFQLEFAVSTTGPHKRLANAVQGLQDPALNRTGLLTVNKCAIPKRLQYPPDTCDSHGSTYVGHLRSCLSQDKSRLQYSLELHPARMLGSDNIRWSGCDPQQRMSAASRLL